MFSSCLLPFPPMKGNEMFTCELNSLLQWPGLRLRLRVLVITQELTPLGPHFQMCLDFTGIHDTDVFQLIQITVADTDRTKDRFRIFAF